MSELNDVTPTGEKRGTKRKLEPKTNETKYDAIMAVERGTKSKKEIAAQFNIPASTLSRWIKNSNEIKQKYLSGEMGPQRKKDKKAKYPEVEEALLRWFASARTQNVTINGEIMREKACQFAVDLGVPQSEFDCSGGWLERFKVRHGIVFKRVCGESNSVNNSSESMEDWKSRLATILKDYHRDDIFNADETGIFYRLQPDKTLEFKAKSCHGGKQSKERLTALVCANMSGTEKLPLLVIGKSAQPRCFKNIKSLPTLYKSNKKAWMTSELFIEWVRKLDLDMTHKKRSIALIVDNCPAHLQISGLESVKLVFLPPNTTSVTQPMDQAVIRNLKVNYRKQVITKKIGALDNGTDLCITILGALRMLHQAWGCVTQATIANCYRHAGFKIVEEQEHEPETTDSEEIDDDISLAQLSRLIRGATMEQYVDVDNHILTCDELSDNSIISDIVSARNIDQTSEDEEETPAVSQPRPTLEAAMNACDILSQFLETCSNAEGLISAVARVSHFVTNAHLQKHFTKQTSLTHFFKKVESCQSDRC